MITKRWITLPVVYSRPFAAKAVFWAILNEFDAQKTAFEANGWLYTPGKVIQPLVIIDLYTQLAIYGYRWGKR